MSFILIEGLSSDGKDGAVDRCRYVSVFYAQSAWRQGEGCEAGGRGGAERVDAGAQFCAHSGTRTVYDEPCAADEKLLEFAQMVMGGDLAMLEYVPGNMYNFHPGSHVKQGAEVGIEKIAALLNSVLHKDLHTTVLLETMAGKGTEVGRSFEELAAILSKVQLNEKMGVCLDTCHIFDGGYDIVNDLDGVLAQFDKIIGLERLKAVHLNDSLNIAAATRTGMRALAQAISVWRR